MCSTTPRKGPLVVTKTEDDDDDVVIVGGSFNVIESLRSEFLERSLKLVPGEGSLPLYTFMNWLVKKLEKTTVHPDNRVSLWQLMIKMINFLADYYYDNRDKYFNEDYYIYMELLLARCCNLEVSIQEKIMRTDFPNRNAYKDYIASTTTKISRFITVSLFNSIQNLYHVLFKMECLHFESCKRIMRGLHMHMLLFVDMDDTEESAKQFCIARERFRMYSTSLEHHFLLRWMLKKFKKTLPMVVGMPHFEELQPKGFPKTWQMVSDCIKYPDTVVENYFRQRLNTNTKCSISQQQIENLNKMPKKLDELTDYFDMKMMNRGKENVNNKKRKNDPIRSMYLDSVTVVEEPVSDRVIEVKEDGDAEPYVERKVQLVEKTVVCVKQVELEPTAIITLDSDSESEYTVQEVAPNYLTCLGNKNSSMYKKRKKPLAITESEAIVPEVKQSAPQSVPAAATKTSVAAKVLACLSSEIPETAQRTDPLGKTVLVQETIEKTDKCREATTDEVAIVEPATLPDVIEIDDDEAEDAVTLNTSNSAGSSKPMPEIDKLILEPVERIGEKTTSVRAAVVPEKSSGRDSLANARLDNSSKSVIHVNTECEKRSEKYSAVPEIKREINPVNHESTAINTYDYLPFQPKRELEDNNDDIDYALYKHSQPVEVETIYKQTTQNFGYKSYRDKYQNIGANIVIDSSAAHAVSEAHNILRNDTTNGIDNIIATEPLICEKNIVDCVPEELSNDNQKNITHSPPNKDPPSNESDDVFAPEASYTLTHTDRSVKVAISDKRVGGRVPEDIGEIGDCEESDALSVPDESNNISDPEEGDAVGVPDGCAEESDFGVLQRLDGIPGFKESGDVGVPQGSDNIATPKGSVAFLEESLSVCDGRDAVAAPEESPVEENDESAHIMEKNPKRSVQATEASRVNAFNKASSDDHEYNEEQDGNEEDVVDLHANDTLSEENQVDIANSSINNISISEPVMIVQSHKLEKRPKSILKKTSKRSSEEQSTLEYYYSNIEINLFPKIDLPVQSTEYIESPKYEKISKKDFTKFYSKGEFVKSVKFTEEVKYIEESRPWSCEPVTIDGIKCYVDPTDKVFWKFEVKIQPISDKDLAKKYNIKISAVHNTVRTCIQEKLQFSPSPHNTDANNSGNVGDDINGLCNCVPGHSNIDSYVQGNESNSKTDTIQMLDTAIQPILNPASQHSNYYKSESSLYKYNSNLSKGKRDDNLIRKGNKYPTPSTTSPSLPESLQCEKSPSELTEKLTTFLSVGSPQPQLSKTLTNSTLLHVPADCEAPHCTVLPKPFSPNSSITVSSDCDMQCPKVKKCVASKRTFSEVLYSDQRKPKGTHQHRRKHKSPHDKSIKKKRSESSLKGASSSPKSSSTCEVWEDNISKHSSKRNSNMSSHSDRHSKHQHSTVTRESLPSKPTSSSPVSSDGNLQHRKEAKDTTKCTQETNLMTEPHSAKKNSPLVDFEIGHAKPAELHPTKHSSSAPSHGGVQPKVHTQTVKSTPSLQKSSEKEYSKVIANSTPEPPPSKRSSFLSGASEGRRSLTSDTKVRHPESTNCISKTTPESDSPHQVSWDSKVQGQEHKNSRKSSPSLSVSSNRDVRHPKVPKRITKSTDNNKRLSLSVLSDSNVTENKLPKHTTKEITVLAHQFYTFDFKNTVGEDGTGYDSDVSSCGDGEDVSQKQRQSEEAIEDVEFDSKWKSTETNLSVTNNELDSDDIPVEEDERVRHFANDANPEDDNDQLEDSECEEVQESLPADKKKMQAIKKIYSNQAVKENIHYLPHASENDKGSKQVHKKPYGRNSNRTGEIGVGCEADNILTDHIRSSDSRPEEGPRHIAIPRRQHGCGVNVEYETENNITSDTTKKYPTHSYKMNVEDTCKTNVGDMIDNMVLTSKTSLKRKRDTNTPVQIDMPMLTDRGVCKRKLEKRESSDSLPGENELTVQSSLHMTESDPILLSHSSIPHGKYHHIIDNIATSGQRDQSQVSVIVEPYPAQRPIIATVTSENPVSHRVLEPILQHTPPTNLYQPRCSVSPRFKPQHPPNIPQIHLQRFWQKDHLNQNNIHGGYNTSLEENKTDEVAYPQPHNNTVHAISGTFAFGDGPQKPQTTTEPLVNQNAVSSTVGIQSGHSETYLQSVWPQHYPNQINEHRDCNLLTTSGKENKTGAALPSSLEKDKLVFNTTNAISSTVTLENELQKPQTTTEHVVNQNAMPSTVGRQSGHPETDSCNVWPQDCLNQIIIQRDNPSITSVEENRGEVGSYDPLVANTYSALQISSLEKDKLILNTVAFGDDSQKPDTTNVGIQSGHPETELNLWLHSTFTFGSQMPQTTTEPVVYQTIMPYTVGIQSGHPKTVIHSKRKGTDVQSFPSKIRRISTDTMSPTCSTSSSADFKLTKRWMHRFLDEQDFLERFRTEQIRCGTKPEDLDKDVVYFNSNDPVLGIADVINASNEQNNEVNPTLKNDRGDYGVS